MASLERGASSKPAAPSGIARAAEGRLPPGSIVGNYRLIECVGEGSFALVYRAQHAHLEREVAIKILRSGVSEEGTFRERFRREAVAVSKIVHPNVVGIVDFGEMPDGVAYLVMEWVKGKTLHRAIAEGQMFPAERIAHLLRQLALGLEAAHRLGLIHRDLKSGNVMLAEVDDPSAEAAKIVDFGLVRATFDENQLTQAGQVLGTPQFMDPEMIVGRPVQKSADLYALGIIGFQMLTGRLPFSGKNAIEIMRKQVSDPPPPLPSAHGLGALITELMQKEARLRPPSAAAVASAIDGLGIAPWRPSDPEMMRTELGPPQIYETTPIVVTPRASVEASTPPAPTLSQRTPSSPVAPSPATLPPAPPPSLAGRLLVGFMFGVVALIAAGLVRLFYEKSGPEAIIQDKVAVEGRAIEELEKDKPVALPVARAAREDEIRGEPVEGGKDLRRPRSRRKELQAPAGVAAKEPDLVLLRRDLDRTLDDLGLEPRDLSSFESLADKYARFDRAAKAKDGLEAQAAADDLKTSLQHFSAPEQFLKSKLARVNALLGKATDKLDSSELQRCESEYLDLVTAVQPGLSEADATALARRIKKLDILLRAHVH